MKQQYEMIRYNKFNITNYLFDHMATTNQLPPMHHIGWMLNR